MTITIICRIKSGGFKFIKSIDKKSLYYYSSSGVALLVGRYALLAAFTLIPVWQAVAIRNIQPILAIILSWLIFKKAERVSFRLIVGAVIVTLGMVFLNLY